MISIKIDPSSLYMNKDKTTQSSDTSQKPNPFLQQGENRVPNMSGGMKGVNIFKEAIGRDLNRDPLNEALFGSIEKSGKMVRKEWDDLMRILRG